MAIAAEKTLGRLPSFALMIAIFAISIGTAVYLIHAGASPGLGYIGGNVVGILLTILFEYLAPRVAWRPSRRELLQDIFHMGFVNGIVRPITRGVVIATIIAGITTLNARGVLPDRPNLSSAPLLVQILVFMLLLDIAYYTSHRLLHGVDALWRYHSIHHASTSLYWLKGVRIHFGEVIFSGVMIILAGAMVRVSPMATLIGGLIASTMGMLHHANIAFKLDWLSFIIIPPDLHRVHHSADAREGRTNYSAVLSICDLLFRTLHVTTPKQLGLGLGEGSPTSFVDDFLFPFRRRPQEANPEVPAGRVATGGDE